MQRFQNVLVVLDERTENRAVVERAVILAQRNQAQLTLANTARALPRPEPEPITPEPPVDALELAVDIIEEWPPDAGPPDTPLQEPIVQGPGGAMMLDTEAPVVIQEQIVEEGSRRLQPWLDFIRESGVPAEGKVLHGTPFLEVIREVLRNEYDLVMITAEGRGGLRERLFGSTTMHLMRKCPCPVWVVTPTQPERYTRIMAAVDPNPQDEEQHAINIKIMDLATALARRDGCELVIIHTWTFPAERSLRGGYSMESAELDRWRRQARDLHRRRLTELLQRYPLQELRSQVYMLKGEPGHLIPRLAAKLEVGLIVMGTVSRTGVGGLFIGNTAERILRQVHSSVLTVKPDGFATPVRLDG
jgi:nucleotide-binding universal stress UspA family protein